jgi:chorismate synthase
MASNRFGLIYCFMTFGESHGPCVGVSLDGVPAGFPLDLGQITQDLNRRRPGSDALVSQRQETDAFEVISGLFQGKTTGAPLSFQVANRDARKKDYDEILECYRPGHADYTYHKKYGHFSPLGGGRASARETVGRVIAGSVARQFLSCMGIEVKARLSRVGRVTGDMEALRQEIGRVRKLGDSVGGQVEVEALNVPPGIGEPMYERLDARLAFALMSIQAVKAVEIGEGVEVAQLRGSENNDGLRKDGFESNHAGGILGGISTGQPICVRISLKPTPSIPMAQSTVTHGGEEVRLKLKGRHDPCVALRSLVIAEAMVAQVIFDLILYSKIVSGDWSPQSSNGAGI